MISLNEMRALFAYLWTFFLIGFVDTLEISPAYVDFVLEKGVSNVFFLNRYENQDFEGRV